MSRDDFVAQVLRNRAVAALLQRWSALALPDGWLVAGCLFQTAWNLQGGRAPTDGIRDYDLFYFDATDLSPEGERAVQQRAEAVAADLGITIEAKNQARVHLWYEGDFGHPYPQLRDAREGIDRFLVLETCVGLRPNGDGGWELYAPNGLHGIAAGTLSPNPLTDHRALFEAKAASYQARWPWLRIATPSQARPLVRP